MSLSFQQEDVTGCVCVMITQFKRIFNAVFMLYLGTEKCRGIGYVTFSMEDDAQRALKEVKEYDGQKIVVVLAKKKPDDKKRRKTKIKEGETHYL